MFPSFRTHLSAGRGLRSGRAALWLLLIAFGGAGAADLLPLSAEQKQALGIQTAGLDTQPGAVAAGLPARVVVPPSQVAVLAAPVTGLVRQVDKTHNDPVQPGEPVMTLSSVQLVEDQLALYKAASQRRLVAENAARDAKLFKEGIIPEARYRAARAEDQRAEAEVKALRERLRLSGLDAAAIQRAEDDAAVTETVPVRSPMAGKVIELEAVPGARFEIGAPLAKVADLSRLWLEIRVPAEQATLVQSGLPVKVTGTGAGGVVTLVEAEISGAETVKVRAEIGEMVEQLRPGQAVEVRIGAGAGARQWRVPSAALVWQAGKAFLFVEVPEGFRPQPVTVLNQAAAFAGVTGELTGDERVAIRGVAALKSIWLGGAEAGN